MNLANTLMELFDVEERAGTVTKQIKGTKPKVADIRKPKCPTHQQDMEYEPAIGRWKCPEPSCQFTATRKSKDEEAPASKPPIRKLAAPKKPTPVYSGDDRIRLLMAFDPVSGEDQYILTATIDGQEVGMNITGHVETVIDDQTNSVTLCLLFHDVQRK